MRTMLLCAGTVMVKGARCGGGSKQPERTVLLPSISAAKL
jgi:hypothetical protein